MDFAPLAKLGRWNSRTAELGGGPRLGLFRQRPGNRHKVWSVLWRRKWAVPSFSRPYDWVSRAGRRGFWCATLRVRWALEEAGPGLTVLESTAPLPRPHARALLPSGPSAKSPGSTDGDPLDLRERPRSCCTWAKLSDRLGCRADRPRPQREVKGMAVRSASRSVEVPRASLDPFFMFSGADRTKTRLRKFFDDFLYQHSAHPHGDGPGRT